MATEFIIAKNGISRDEERDYAKALQFMGYDSAIIFCHNPKIQKSEIPQIKIYYGELLDSENKRRINNEIICLLDATNLDEDEIINIMKKEKIDLICNLTPLKNSKKIMQYPSSSFTEAFFQNLNRNSTMLGFSSNIINDKNSLIFNMFTAKLALNNNARIIFSSFPYNSNQIRSENDFKGLLPILGIKPDYYKKSLKYKEDLQKKQFHNNFLMSVERKL
jgi:hypothetical protein